MVGPVEAERRAPVVHHEDNAVRAPDYRIDEGSEISAVGRETIGVGIGIWQFGGIAHADQVRRDQPAAPLKFGNDVAPQIGRGRIAVQKQHRRALAALVIGHAGAQHLDGLFCQRLFGHLFFSINGCVWTTMPRDRVERSWIPHDSSNAWSSIERDVGPHRLSVFIRDADPEAGKVSSPP
jgi:hypothetical protein